MRHRMVICVLLVVGILPVAMLLACGQEADEAIPPAQEVRAPEVVAESVATPRTSTTAPTDLTSTVEAKAVSVPAAPAPSTPIDYEPTQKKKTPTTLEGHPNLAPSDKMEHSPAPRVSQPQTLATT